MSEFLAIFNTFILHSRKYHSAYHKPLNARADFFHRAKIDKRHRMTVRNNRGIRAKSIFFLSILYQYSAIIEFRHKERKEEFNLLSVFIFIFSFCCMQFVHNEQF